MISSRGVLRRLLQVKSHRENIQVCHASDHLPTSSPSHSATFVRSSIHRSANMISGCRTGTTVNRGQIMCDALEHTDACGSNRRRFLRTAGAAAALGLLGPGLFAPLAR